MGVIQKNNPNEGMKCASGDKVRFTVDMSTKTMKCEKLGVSEPSNQFMTKKFDKLEPILLPAIQINNGEVKVKFL
jgi:hypothetical protein